MNKFELTSLVHRSWLAAQSDWKQLEPRMASSLRHAVGSAAIDTFHRLNTVRGLLPVWVSGCVCLVASSHLRGAMVWCYLTRDGARS